MSYQPGYHGNAVAVDLSLAGSSPYVDLVLGTITGGVMVSSGPLNILANASGNFTIASIANIAPGQKLILVNATTHTMTLTHNDASGTLGMRFANVNGASEVVSPGGTIEIV